MKKITFDDVCKYLEDNDLDCISMKNGNKRIYVDKDKFLHIIVEENIPEYKLTKEDTDRIEKRLKELGYLD